MKLLLNVATCMGALFLIARPASAQSDIGNLTCFKVTDPMPRAKFQVSLGGEAGPMHCTLKAPARRACIATSGTVTPAPPDMGAAGAVSTSFLCYQAKCSAPGPRAAEFEDAFGQRAATFRAPQMLCLPASVGGVTTTTTTIGGATTTTVPSGCRFANGECTGSCAAGMRCGAVAGTGSCGCLRVPCGQADVPECSGFCSEPSEACIFSVTGCSCVRMP
jgi:hypothetical protein